METLIRQDAVFKDEIYDARPADTTLRRGSLLRETTGMLDESQSFVQGLLSQSSTMDRELTSTLTERRTGIEVLLVRTQDQVVRVDHQIALVASFLAIEESKKGIQQAESMKILTTLATIYIPLSFVSGLLGMNISQISPSSSVSISMFFIIALRVSLSSSNVDATAAVVSRVPILSSECMDINTSEPVVT
ncbi:hypothetical protein MMC18_009034 [Xylographa bjoerkii]|nr:hypothetical protein [Xylographa bjoerkii]